jgi:hypothetical protein
MSNGNIFLLEDSHQSVLFNPKTKSVRKNLISSQFVADAIAISSSGEFLALALASGNVLVYKQTGEYFTFIKNIYLPNDQGKCSLMAIDTYAVEDKLIVHRFVSDDLENTIFLVDILSQDLIFSADGHFLPGKSQFSVLEILTICSGIKFAQLTKVIHYEDFSICLAVDNDCITYCTFQFCSRRFKTCVFKIRNRPSNKPFSFIMVGPNYNLNDYSCPSFFLFGPGNEILLGIIYADTIKFWNVSSELEDIQSGVHSEESGLFFCSSPSKSAFMEVFTGIYLSF